MHDTFNKNFIKKSSRSKSRPMNSFSGRQDYHSMGYQTGMLPTLGLNRYKNSDIQLGSQNPFTVQMETEKLLIAREREREFKDSNKEEKFALRVFQKSIQTRQNRAGVIREINGIKPQQRGQFHSMTHTEKKNNQLALLDISNDEVNSKKINIFDEINTNQKIGSMLKQDNLIKLTNQNNKNNKQLSLYQNDDQLSASKVSMSQTYSSSNELQPYTNKPKALDYLNKHRENKESTRDFITNARNILVAQISINDKTEETERLKEYIIMEREKLEEAKKTFDEDKDKFQKYMDDLNRKAEETAAEVQKLTLDKNEKIDRITQLVNKIQQKKSNTKQIEEKLMLFKQHKMFLDQLAVSAGKKQAVRRKLTQHQQQMQINNNNADKSGQGSPRKLNRNSKKEMSNFFLTQLNQQGVNVQSKNKIAENYNSLNINKISMKKGQAPPPQPEPTQEKEEIKEVPQSGIGRFEYINGTMYVGNWKLSSGVKVKNGHGKITFSGTTASEFGNEEYEGDWEEDLMHGYGTYKYTSGAEYSGQWSKGKQHGIGTMQYADGSKYEGCWENNLMHGDGVYTDSDQVRWEGIFVNGTFESKIQKKLQAEKILKEKRKAYEEKAKEFFTKFLEAFAKSDKKTFKDNLTPFFATVDHVQEFVSDPYPKFEEKQPDKWNDWIKTIYSDGKCKIKALGSKEEASLIPQGNIQAEQLREKPGGQLVEVVTQVNDKNFVSVLCELPNENWVLVYYAEKAL